MGITKKENFTIEQNHLALIAKVLGHPARISILQQLKKSNSCICNDFVKETELAQPTISKHLKELKSIGIIKGSIEGSSHCYCIDNIKWNQIRELLHSFFSDIPSSKEECC